jgi:hypothetical protein
MMRRSLTWLVVCLISSGCMSETTRYVTRGVGQQELVIEPAGAQPSIMGDFTVESGTVRGHVGWTYDCRKAIVATQETQVINVKKPEKEAGFAAAVIGVGVGALSVGLLSSLDQFSDVQTCSIDSDGQNQCSSPRTNAAVVGVLGLATSAGLFGTGLVTLGASPTASVVATEAAPPVVSRVVQENVACGTEPIAGLGLVLMHDGSRVAASTTNAAGEVAFAVPPGLSGGFIVRIDAVPAPYDRVRVGDVVGTVQVKAPVEPAAPASS